MTDWYVKLKHFLCGGKIKRGGVVKWIFPTSAPLNKSVLLYKFPGPFYCAFTRLFTSDLRLWRLWINTADAWLKDEVQVFHLPAFHHRNKNLSAHKPFLLVQWPILVSKVSQKPDKNPVRKSHLNKSLPAVPSTALLPCLPLPDLTKTNLTGSHRRTCAS